jgi:hypothetical protein
LIENPVLRVLAFIVVVAVGIRLTFELLEPVWPYLLVTLLLLVCAWVASWYRRRW